MEQFKNDQGNVVGGQVVLAAQGLGSSTIVGGFETASTIGVVVIFFGSVLDALVGARL